MQDSDIILATSHSTPKSSTLSGTPLASVDLATQASRQCQSVTEDDFMLLGKYEAIARVATGDGVSAPLTMTTIEPAKGYGTANAVRYVSRQNHGRNDTDVAADIINRRKIDQKPRSARRPRISSWADEPPREALRTPTVDSVEPDGANHGSGG